MKKFVREHYTLKSYEGEKFKLIIMDEETHMESTEYSDTWEPLYMKAKKLAKEGKVCEIWEMKYVFG